MELEQTPLYRKHLQNNGRIINFFGWALPVEYKSMLKEAKQTRTHCGLFDVSHMGEIIIKGSSSLNFVNKLVSNNLSLISTGQMQYNLFLNVSGGIIDDCMIYRREKSLLCVVNASNKDKVLFWLEENKQDDVEIIDRSRRVALISLQGPLASQIGKKVFGEDIANLPYLSFTEDKVKGKEILISRSGYTAEDGFEIYTSWEDACFWWDKLMEVGEDFELTPCGLGARDILRIEAGYPLYGHEIDDSTNPYEASLEWAVKLNKDFIGKDKILKVKEEGLKRKRVGFIMQERGLSRQNYNVYHRGKRIGKVCSGTYSPNLEKFIGMAYVEKDFAFEGTEIDIEIRDKFYKAKVANFPFIQPKVKKINSKGVNYLK